MEQSYIRAMGDAEFEELSLKFDFKVQPDKLLIKAYSPKCTYEGQIEVLPYLRFQKLIQSIEQKKFKQIKFTDEELEIQVCFITLNLFNKQKIVISKLQQTITELTKKLDNQIQKNANLQSTIIHLRKDVDLIISRNAGIAEQKKQHDLELAFQSLKQNFQSLKVQSRLQNQVAAKQLDQCKTIISEHQKSIKELQEKNKQAQKLILQTISTQNDKNMVAQSSKQFSPQKQQQPKMVTQSPEKLKHEQKSLFMGGSAVISSSEEVNIILGFFNKKISSFKLIYRASENQFSVQQFHQKCDNIPNTIVVCKTEFNKKVAGFTPLTWQSTNGLSKKADSSGESFVFSVTHNEKFTLKDKNEAITNHKNYGPIFGLDDLAISDNANTNNSSYSYVNYNYCNNNYKQDGKKSFDRFCGNPSGCNFKVAEWEVWKVEFA